MTETIHYFAGLSTTSEWILDPKNHFPVVLFLSMALISGPAFNIN